LKTSKAHYKHILPVQSNLFTSVLQESTKDFEYPWHYHPEIELTYILTSHGMRYVGNCMENFFDDDLVLIGANLPHCWISSSSPTTPSSAIVVYLKPELLDNTWMKSPEFQLIRQLLDRSIKGIKFSRKIALEVKDQLYSLAALPSFEKFLLLLEILQKLALTDSYHILCEQGFSYELNYSHNERINKVYKYIQDHFLEKISLSDISSHVNMTEETFSRFFSKTMKKSFFEFLNEYKINRACKLLIESDKQVTEICYASGFESIPFFYRQFKKFKKSQPKNYRSNYQKIVS